MRFERSLLLIFLLACLSAVVQAQPHSGRGFVVIVHPTNPISSVTPAFLADVFLKRTTRWSSGETIRPADLGRGASTRVRFSETVLRRSVAGVRAHWQQIIFSGRGVPPVEVDDDAAAVRFVLRHRGAIAYVSPEVNVGRAKVVAIR